MRTTLKALNDQAQRMTMENTIDAIPPFAGAHGSATVEKPHKVHVWVCGHYCGTYDFETAEEADADYEYRQGFRVLGCHYRRESPNREL